MNQNDAMAPEVGEGELDFSGKYSKQKADEYYEKHLSTFGRRFSNRWEHGMARRALRLAGNPSSVLDLPCGAGRFWDLLAEDPERELYAADYSEGMLVVAKQLQPDAIASRFQVFQTSAFDIRMEDESVDSILCMRLLHHVGERADRMRIYREFHRVTRDTVCISLWVDGNYKAWRRLKLEQDRSTGRKPRKRNKNFQNRFVHRRADLEQEFAEAGFDILGKVDFLPGYSMWRTYVLGKKREQ
ncbi:class I SAM-dependent methyltransferase [Thiolapillus brandeum]|nr:class I SAM-dependent methyltransferase [Thiolapillus brandeum]